MHYLLDVNVWLALTADSHSHSVAARKWLEATPPEPVLAFCRISQLGLLRLLCNPAVLQEDVVSPARAWYLYDNWRADSRVVFHNEPPGLERAFREATRRESVKTSDWADAYLAAFARLIGYTLVTFDRDLARRAADATILISREVSL